MGGDARGRVKRLSQVVHTDREGKREKESVLEGEGALRGVLDGISHFADTQIF